MSTPAPMVMVPATPTVIPSALPGPAARQLEAARAAAAAAAQPTATNDPPATPTPTTPDTPAATNEPQGERITLSREEYNAMRAGSEARAIAEGRAESAQLALEEAQHRLTELAQVAKATPQVPTPAATVVADAPQITFTAEEEEAFAESRPYIEKVVRLIIGQELTRLLPEIHSKIEAVKQAADGAVNRVTVNTQRSFLEQVRANVPNLAELIKHKHWNDFQDAQEPLSGLPYGVLLSKNVEDGKLEQVVNVYKAFQSKYMDPASAASNANAGYAGATPTGGAVQVPADQLPEQKLKFSDRKKASIDFRHGRITYDQLQEVNKKFDEADKKGNVDYNA